MPPASLVVFKKIKKSCQIMGKHCLMALAFFSMTLIYSSLAFSLVLRFKLIGITLGTT